MIYERDRSRFGRSFACLMVRIVDNRVYVREGRSTLTDDMIATWCRRTNDTRPRTSEWWESGDEKKNCCIHLGRENLKRKTNVIHKSSEYFLLCAVYNKKAYQPLLKISYSRSPWLMRRSLQVNEEKLKIGWLLASFCLLYKLWLKSLVDWLHLNVFYVSGKMIFLIKLWGVRRKFSALS